MKKRNINMYDVILKSKKQDSLYMPDDYVFSSPSIRTSGRLSAHKEPSIKFFIAHDVTTNMSKDMERMMSFMVKSIMEGILYGRK